MSIYSHKQKFQNICCHFFFSVIAAIFFSSVQFYNQKLSNNKRQLRTAKIYSLSFVLLFLITVSSLIFPFSLFFFFSFFFIFVFVFCSAVFLSFLSFIQLLLFVLWPCAFVKHQMNREHRINFNSFHQQYYFCYILFIYLSCFLHAYIPFPTLLLYSTD